MKKLAYYCPACKEAIYLRHIRDIAKCSCQAVGMYCDGETVAGEPGATIHVLFPRRKPAPIPLTININATERELAEDWDFNGRKFGRVKIDSPDIREILRLVLQNSWDGPLPDWVREKAAEALDSTTAVI